MPTLCYLHGFLSSSSSAKAQQTKQWLSAHHPGWQFICPDLPSKPTHTQAFLDAFFDQPQMQNNVVLIGSSLGGFWSHYVAHTRGFPAVLINPAISPQERFHNLIGQPLKHYHRDEVCVLDEQDLNAMRACDLAPPTDTDQYWLMVQTEDEVLDYTLAVKKFLGCRQTVESGGNHSFQGYESWLPEIFEFLNQRLYVS